MNIALCGSAKFEQEWIEVNRELTLSGHTVYALSVFPSQANGDKDWYTDQEKTVLDLVHLSKIENSDAIVAINKGQYIGESTCREIVWAAIRHKLLYAYEPFTKVLGHNPTSCIRRELYFNPWHQLLI